MDEPEVATTGWKPPYVAYSTLRSFIDKKCGENPIPPQIDKTFIDNVAGGVQPLLLSALKIVGFIRDDATVEPLLRDAASSASQRKEILRTWAQAYYAEQQRLAEDNATAQMLFDSFASSGYSGSTLRKAVAFYLNLVDDVGLAKSAHFKLPRQTQPSKGRKAAQSKANGGRRGDDPGVTSKLQGEQTIIDLGNAGKVTVVVDVRWLSLSDDVFTGLRQAIRDLEALATNGGKAVVVDEGGTDP